MNVKNAAKIRQDLITGGKTPEELPAALGEALKLEGTRLEFMVSVLDIVGTKLNDLKRAIVYAPNEGEKAPQGLIQKGDHFYLVEYFASLNKPAQPAHSNDHRHRGGKGGDKRQGRGGPEGGRSYEKKAPALPPTPGFKRPDSQIIIAPATAGTTAPTGQDRPRPDHPRGPRPPRTPRPQRAIPVTIVGGPPVIIKPVTPIEPKAPVDAPMATPVETHAEAKEV